MVTLRSVLALSLCFLATSARAQQPFSLRLDFLPAGYHGVFFLAIDKGWFQKVGIDLSVADGNGSATAVQLVGSGQVDVAHAAMSVMAVAQSKGVPLTSTAAIFRKGDIALLLPEESPVHSVKDLAGKTVAFAASSFEAPFMNIFLATGGQTSATVKLQNMDASSKTATAIAGTVDGGVMGSDVNQLPLIRAKRPARAITFSDVGLNFPGYGLVVNPDNLKRKAELFKRFVSVTSGAWSYMLDGHERETIEALMRHRPQAKLDPEILLAQIVEARKHLYTPSTEKLPIGVQTDTDWIEALAVLERAGALPPGSKPADHYTNDYFDNDLIDKVAHDKF